MTWPIYRFLLSCSVKNNEYLCFFRESDTYESSNNQALQLGVGKQHSHLTVPSRKYGNNDKRKSHVETKDVVSDNRSSCETNKGRSIDNMISSKTSAVKAANKKLLKIFLTISLLFFVSFVPVFLAMTGVIHNFYVMYAYFINHFGNPIIYFYIDKSFRKDTYRLAKIILCLT